MKFELGDFLYKSGITFQIRRINKGKKNTIYGVERIYTWAHATSLREPIPFSADFNQIIYLSYDEILKNFDFLQRSSFSSSFPFPQDISLSQISLIASREFLIEKANLIHRREK